VECSVHKLVADVALIAEGHVLFVRYADPSKYDGQRGWFLPDDFLAHGEHPADAARRIVEDQSGLDAPALRLFQIESFGGEKTAWHLVFHYRGELDEAAPVEPAGNVAEARWFALDALPPASEVAHHGWALEVLETASSEK
jgi:ADP-ribose pyrophosphatase YjhB (NUDIX family)